jgi:CelD/BcsL family acetyltransferase involved in cellulose biosynthesis
MSGQDGSPRSVSRPWSVIEVVHDVAAIAQEWDDLADRAGADPFARPGWFSAWWGAFGDEGRLGVVALRGAGRLRALAPLVRRGPITSSPTNAHTPRFALLGEDDESLEDLAAILLRLRQRRLSLSPLDAGGPSLAAMRSAGEAARYRLVERVELQSPYRSLEGIGAADELVERKMRKELRRCRRRLEELGTLALVAERGDGALDAALADAFEVEARGWKGGAGTAIASSPETRRFYEDVARWAARRGSLRLMQLRLDGRLLAFELDLLEGGSLYSLKAGFDPEHARHSPGHLVALAAVEEALAAGARTYELLGDAEPYKMRFTDTCRELRSIEASSPTAGGRAEHLKMRVVRPVRGRARRAAGTLRSRLGRRDR